MTCSLVPLPCGRVLLKHVLEPGAGGLTDFATNKQIVSDFVQVQADGKGQFFKAIKKPYNVQGSVTKDHTNLYLKTTY